VLISQGFYGGKILLKKELMFKSRKNSAIKHVNNNFNNSVVYILSFSHFLMHAHN